MSVADPPARPSTRALISSLPLENLMRMVASSEDALAGLQAMAEELGGRDGEKIQRLADAMRRGETVIGTASMDAASLPVLQASSADDISPDGRLPRWIMLRDQQSQTRTRLRRVVWLCLGYLLAATAVGLMIQMTSAALVADIVPAFDATYFSQPASLIQTMYQALIALTVALLILWAIRQAAWCPQWIERFWNRVPFVGSTFRALDLAHMSEAIYQSLSAGWSYSQAFIATASQSRSSLLRDWLIAGADRLDRGETFEMVMKTCPLRANWLRGMSQVLSTSMPVSSLRDQWRSVSDRFHQLMIRRGRRLAVAIAPASVLLSTALIVVGWGAAMKLMMEVMSSMLWFF